MRIPLSAAVGFACLAIGGCGGGSDGSSAPTPANAAQIGALQGSVAAAQGFSATPQAGPLFVDPSSAIEGVLGPSGLVPGLAAAPSRALSAPGHSASALAGSGLQDPACVTLTLSAVTFTNCKTTVDLSSGGNTLIVASTLDGSVSRGTANALAWDLRVVSQITASGANAVDATTSFHFTGTLAVTATTYVGHFASELRVTGTVNGLPVAAGVDEFLDANVTYADAAACASRVTGGTLEAKRVWTARPAGKTAAQLPDAAAKVTWTACGQATIELGTRQGS